MTDFVVDSNTVVKWFVAEEWSDYARRLLGKGNRFFAPDFMPAELTSAMLKKFRQREVIADEVLAAREGIRGAFILSASEVLIDKALRLAMPHNRSSYDSIYAVLAQERGCQFVTADRKLYESLAPVLPSIMLWVEDVPE